MNSNSRLRLVVGAFSFLAALCASRPAAAVVIELPYVGPGLPVPIMTGLTSSAALATATWESYFSDPVVLKFSITSAVLPGGALGYFDVDPTTSPYSYTKVAGALAGDATSPEDFSAVSALQPGPALSMITNDTTSAPTLRSFYPDTSPLTFNSTLRLTSANQKALGLIPGTGGGIGSDGTIVLNSTFLPLMDFDPSDGIGAGLFDMTAILIHEMAHGMGFISGVDHIDYASSDGGLTVGPDFPHDYSTETIFTVLDLYRYSAESVGFITQPPFGKVLDWAAGTSSITDNPYFSIDGGGTSLATFSTGALFGDGFQAQHWKDSKFLGGSPPGIMDPDLGKAELGVVTALDVTALDVIGWTLVPEPSAMWLAAIGLATLTVVGWRRRR
ncbi:MAG: NF038122 family metalloprotease [Pirellulales bacterium]